MIRKQFDLNSLMSLQMTYDPLRKILEYLLDRDKAIGDSLFNLEDRVNSHDKKITELQGTVDTTKSSLSTIKDMEKLYKDQIADCMLF